MTSTPSNGPRRIRRLSRLIVIAALATGALGACGEDEPSGAGGASGGATRTVEIEASEYAFAGDPGDEIVAGETIQFIVSNVGELRHEMQVLDGEGKLLDRTGEIPAGGRDQVTVTFAEAGTYQVICDIDDHLSRGQRAQFVVAESPS